MSTHGIHESDDHPDAVQHAEAGARAWRAVVHAQRGAAPDHADFYNLAGHLVDTFAAIESLARLLTDPVCSYADRQPPGKRVYDDARGVDPRRVDPRERLVDAHCDLSQLAIAAGCALDVANRFWSTISHIGVEDTPPGEGTGVGKVSR
jgi:hypothetical protein